MAIIDEWNEAKKIWSNSSPMMHIFTATSLFLSISSIASLSEAVFKWKSFILDGVNFYKVYISSQIANILNVSGLEYSDADINALVIIGFFYGGLFRVFRSWRKQGRHNTFPTDRQLLVVVLIVILMQGVGEGDGFAYYQIIFFSISFLIISIFLYRERESNPGEFINLVSVPFVSLSAILVLGAINSGLSKT